MSNALEKSPQGNIQVNPIVENPPHSGPEFMTSRRKTRLSNPTLHEISITVAWATAYAEPIPLNDNHPKWADYFAYSEWFRHRICTHLGLQLNTPWEELYLYTGCLVEEQYATKDDFKKAYRFGESQRLHDEMAPEMFLAFEEIKFLIVGRI